MKPPFIGTVTSGGVQFGLCYGDTIKEVMESISASVNAIQGQRGKFRLFVGPTHLYKKHAVTPLPDNQGDNGYLSTVIPKKA